MTLKSYRSRRDLKKSLEPRGTKKSRRTKSPIFVIQKHASRNLHYDVRLEIDGVLVSWAVPKGPSMNPSVKRFAIRTDDHPVAYARFEGVIPSGNYGAGTVMVWDKGTYKNIKEKKGKSVSMRMSLRNGEIAVFLRGKKLRGGFALVRSSRGWLFIKIHDEYADARRNPVNTEKKSAKTGRTMTQIKRDAQAKQKQ